MEQNNWKSAPLLGDEREQLRLLMESVQDYAIFFLDLSGRIVSWNPGVRSVLGYEKDEFLGQNASILFTPEDREQGVPEREIQEAALHGRARDERWHLRKDGSRFYASGSMTALRDKDGALRGYSKILRDITEHKCREEILQNSEERFRLLLEGIEGYAVALLDPQGNVVTWNSGAERILGVRAKEILGRHFSLFYTPEDRERGLPERILREARDRGRFEAEGERVRKDGSRIWVSTTVTAVRDAAGNLRGYSGISRDITQRKRAQEKLAELGAIVASSNDAIIGKTLEGIVTSWNKGAEQLYGYTAAEAIGQSISLLIPADHANDLPEILARIRQGERVEHYETVRRRKDGSLVDISLTVSPVRDAAGRITGASVIARNITERKQIEVERAKQSERNRRIAETFQRSMLTAPERGAFPGLEVEPLYQAALNEAAVGGDFFDAFLAGANRVALVVGDVSGKGLAAAERTSQVKYALRAFVQEYTSPARALGRLNRLMHDTLNDESHSTFVAVSLAVVDTATGRATCALAGAEMPFVLRASGRDPRLIEAGGLPLGIDPEADYAAEVVELEAGDTLLMFTDGLTEAHVRGGPLLEHTGLIRLAEEARLAAPDLREIGDTILDAARIFSGGSFRDDVCLLLARWGQS